MARERSDETNTEQIGQPTDETITGASDDEFEDDEDLDDDDDESETEAE